MYELKAVRDQHGTWRRGTCKYYKKYKRNRNLDLEKKRESMSRAKNGGYNECCFYYPDIPWENITGFLFSRLGHHVDDIVHELKGIVKTKYLMKYDLSPLKLFQYYVDKYRTKRYYCRTGLVIDDNGYLQWDPTGWNDPGVFKTKRSGSRAKKEWNKVHAMSLLTEDVLAYRDTLGSEAPLPLGKLWVEALTDKRKKKELSRELVPVYLVSSFKWMGVGKKKGVVYPKSKKQMEEYIRVALPGIGPYIENYTDPAHKGQWGWNDRFYWYFVIKRKYEERTNTGEI